MNLPARFSIGHYLPLLSCRAELYWEGEGVTQDRDKGMEFMQIAAECGYVDAQMRLGIAYRRVVQDSKWKQDFKKAAFWLCKAAMKDEHRAGYLLSRLYAKGKGVACDLAKAMQWRYSCPVLD